MSPRRMRRPCKASSMSSISSRKAERLVGAQSSVLVIVASSGLHRRRRIARKGTPSDLSGGRAAALKSRSAIARPRLGAAGLALIDERQRLETVSGDGTRRYSDHDADIDGVFPRASAIQTTKKLLHGCRLLLTFSLCRRAFGDAIPNLVKSCDGCCLNTFERQVDSNTGASRRWTISRFARKLGWRAQEARPIQNVAHAACLDENSRTFPYQAGMRSFEKTRPRP